MKGSDARPRITTGEAVLRWGASLAGLWLVGALVTLGVCAQSDQCQLSWPATLLLAGSLAMGGATWLVFAYDKHQAGREGRRVREATLHALTLLGGWSGALLAQRWLRHKSHKTAFQLSAWAGFVLSALALFIVLGWL